MFCEMKLVKMKCFWKEASTLILAAFKKSPVNSICNYELLTLQRSSKSSFMPNGYVFPGGTTEPADSDKVWLDYFSFFNLDISKMRGLDGNMPEIIANETGQVPKLLSLKITAIRETFEETGVLLCFSSNQKLQDVSCITFENLNSWRIKVQKDSREFFNMCQYYKCCPNLNNVYLWSNWLTPTSMGNKRFDTAFFIACVNKTPPAVADKTEVESLSWISPDELMRLCKTKNIWLPPPQVYEVARLLHFKDIKALSKFASDRGIQGCERWMPIQIKTTDGLVSVLPGDDAYDFSDYCTPTEPNVIQLSNEEFRSKFKVLHRMEFTDKIKTKVIVKNYSPTYGHVLPASEC